MAVGIVDVFEMIDIQHNQGKGMRITLGLVEDVLAIVEKGAPIVDASQFITAGQGLCPFFRLL